MLLTKSKCYGIQIDDLTIIYYLHVFHLMRQITNNLSLCLQNVQKSLVDNNPKETLLTFLAEENEQSKGLHVSISLCVLVCVVCGFYYVCICLVSVLSVFVLSLFSERFSKTIRVIHCCCLLKNPCKREENLLGILPLESQTSL